MRFITHAMGRLDIGKQTVQPPLPKPPGKLQRVYCHEPVSILSILPLWAPLHLAALSVEVRASFPALQLVRV